MILTFLQSSFTAILDGNKEGNNLNFPTLLVVTESQLHANIDSLSITTCLAELQDNLFSQGEFNLGWSHLQAQYISDAIVSHNQVPFSVTKSQHRTSIKYETPASLPYIQVHEAAHAMKS